MKKLLLVMIFMHSIINSTSSIESEDDIEIIVSKVNQRLFIESFRPKEKKQYIKKFCNYLKRKLKV